MEATSRRPVCRLSLLSLLFLSGPFLGCGHALERRAASRKRVLGSGATTALPILPDRAAYINRNYGTQIRYSGRGSGAGRQALIASAVLYCASDVPFSTSEEGSLNGAVKFTLPFSLNTITLFTSLPGDPAIRLDAATTARIFQGKITKWNNPSIVALNRGLSLPDKTIKVVVRRDVSGSTQLFTQWLSSAAGKKWTLGSGGLVKWPKSVTTRPLTSGVLNYLKSTPNAITYAGTYAGLSKGFVEALIKNRGKNFVAASTSFIQGSIPRSLPPSTASWAAVSLINRGGGKTWPITSFLYILARKNQVQVGAPGGILKAWLKYLFSPGVQALMNRYQLTPCPASVLSKNLAAVETMLLVSGTKVPSFA